MTIPSGSVQSRRIKYNNSPTLSEIIYQDDTYGVGLDPVIKFNPKNRLENYAAPLTEQISNLPPTGTPLYWWKADNGLVTVHTPTIEYDKVLYWLNSGLALSGTMTPILTGVYQSAVNTYPVARFDLLNGREFVQKEFTTGTGGMVWQMPYTDTFPNFTIHIAFRTDTPVYLLLGDLPTIPFSYPFVISLSNVGTSYMGVRATDGTTHFANYLLTGSARRWYVASVVYDDSVQQQVFWMNNQIVPYTGAFPTANTFSFREIRSWFANAGSAVGEIIVDNQKQTTGTILGWQRYLLAKFSG